MVVLGGLVLAGGLVVAPFAALSEDAAQVTAAAPVNREDWGLTWNTPLETGGFLLSKSVRLEIEAELVRK